MTLPTETIQIISKHRLLNPKSRQSATPERKITRALSLVIRTGLVAPALLAASMSANAADTCKAEIIATLDAQVAMQPMTISAYQRGKLIKSTKRHTAVLELPCGIYTIRIQHNTLSRYRVVSVGGFSTVVIEMGE